MLAQAEEVSVPLNELVQLCAVDSPLFCRSFFPKTARLPNPSFHQAVWDLLDSKQRLVNVLMSRGFAKTSLLRMYTAKRIAYNVSRTIMFISASERHSRRSLRWLMRQIERNALYSSTFGLEPGTPWTPEEMQIINRVEDEPVWVIGLGITGSVRGVNLDDHRPDLIILDDVMNDENVESKRGQDKLATRILGAVKESLSNEAPLAKLVLLNTPQDFNDITQEALKDPEFASARFGCWTTETEDLPLEFRKSAWEQLVSTTDLQSSYRAALARNRLSIFVREKECRLIAQEESSFKPDWLQYFGEGQDEPEPPLDQMYTVLVIDPTPPPSDAQLEKGLIDKDFEAITAVGKYKGKTYVLETSTNRGHDPGWTISEFFRLMARWRCRKCIVETTAYQKTLEWLLKEEMKKARQYYLVQPFLDNKRPKHQRIVDGLTAVASNRMLFCRPEQAEFIDQFLHYSQIRKIKKDDVIETVAIAIIEMSNIGDLAGLDAMTLDEDDYKEIPAYGGCP